jgi:hypothetical protein
VTLHFRRKLNSAPNCEAIPESENNSFARDPTSFARDPSRDPTSLARDPTRDPTVLLRDPTRDPTRFLCDPTRFPRDPTIFLLVFAVSKT